ncbi:hypothetical protein [Bradyrhizobium sp. SZCCHNRI2049]|uniref:hypothetical protein n=1 Tax=Bradyrhizobium sp. SZCCHNRI2049 TaxID=3057287 RepID=UPI00291679DC|nr:hypothetical protein [Bradyrhizobium sp. SZCCHNRI2049]
MTMFTNRVRFIIAKHRQCKFFLPGESGARGFVCGELTAIDRSFCDHHHAHCFKTLTPVSRATARFDDQSVAEIDIEDAEHELTELVW